MPLFSWDQVCKPIREGGLGIKKIRSMNKALLAKQGWRTYHYEKEWSNIWKNKYVFNVNSLADFLSSPDVLYPSAIWGAIQGKMNTLGKGCS